MGRVRFAESDDAKYHLVGDQDPVDTALAPACRNCASSKQLRCLAAASWVLTSMLLIGFSGLLSVQDLSTKSRSAAGVWRESEFPPVKEQLSAANHPVLFDALLEFDENRTLHRPVTDPPYVGPPSPEIDAAWKELMGPVTVFLTPEEVRHFEGHKLRYYPNFGLYKAFVTVFHDLHCVNLVRKALHLDYYPELLDETLTVHVDHCLDSLRLSLMCIGDMTFMPLETSAGGDWDKPITPTVYSCRDYRALRSWSKVRDATNEEGIEDRAEKMRGG